MDTKEILNLAKLARIELEDSEAQSLSGEFGSILNYVGEVKSIKIPLSVGTPPDNGLKSALRDDGGPHESGIYTKKILEQAPDKEGDYIKVKKIL